MQGNPFNGIERSAYLQLVLGTGLANPFNGIERTPSPLAPNLFFSVNPFNGIESQELLGLWVEPRGPNPFNGIERDGLKVGARSGADVDESIQWN